MPEKVVWNALRAGRLRGHKFRRQHPIEGYVLDFFCEASLLAVEIDGAHHGTRRDRDQARDETLARLGVRTLRFTAGQVAKDLDAVLETILRYTNERAHCPHPARSARHPLPMGEGAE
jgi:very-short-patch-repair endonuclease